MGKKKFKYISNSNMNEEQQEISSDNSHTKLVEVLIHTTYFEKIEHHMNEVEDL